jgi:hypothetical protein
MSEPEVFLLDLKWDGIQPPTKMQILKVLVSLPESFCSQDLFAKSDPIRYTIKGLICHQSGHYFSFFRRVAHLNQIDGNLIREAVEIEWTMFNDEQVICYGPWKNVVEYCVSQDCYPTVVIYEKYQQI